MTGSSPALAAPGDLDWAFGTGGRVIVDIENDDDSPAGLLLQPDGKIVVGRSNTAESDDFSVLRFDPNGSPDTTFGDHGRSSLDIPGAKGTTRLLLRQPDGKLVAIGATFVSGVDTEQGLGLVRYLEDGSLDPTFGVGGIAIHSGGYPPTSAVLQPDGRLLVAGTSWRAAQRRDLIVVARFEPDGSLDRSFGEDGYAFGDGDTSEHAAGLSLQADGGFVVFANVESATPKNWYDWSPAILRFNPDGSLDAAFGANGRALHLSESWLVAAATQSDGRMLLAAANHPYHWDISYCGGVLARVFPDGRKDGSFGTGGAKQAPFGGCGTFGGALLIEPFGNIVVDNLKGTNDVVDNVIDSFDYVVTRLDASGELDSSFAQNGEAVLEVGDANYPPYAGSGGNLLRQEDGKFVIVTSGIRGLVSSGDNYRMVLARLVPSGGAPGLLGIKAVDPKPRTSDGRIPILIRRSGGSQGVVSVDYSTAPGPSGQGFVPLSGTLTWGDGDRADKLIVIDSAQGFTLSLANPTGGAVLAMSEIQVPIQTTTNPVPGGVPVIRSNNRAGSGGGAMSWQVVVLLALGLLRLALRACVTARSRT